MAWSCFHSIQWNFVEQWVDFYGYHYTVTTDRSKKFGSDILSRITNMKGTNRIRTIASHLAGLVEHFHRQLKPALRFREKAA